MIRAAMKAKARGFTLLELMITIALVAILLGIGAPSFAEFIRNSRITSKSNDLLAAMHLARTESIKRRAPVTVCGSGNSDAAAPACDTNSFDEWIVFVDEDGNPAVAATDGDGEFDPGSGEILLLRSAPARDDISTFPSDDVGGYVQFGLDGFQRRAGGVAPTDLDIRLCHDAKGNVITSGADDSAARALLVTRTGRPEITRSFARIDGLGGCE
jgi:type IV fimbrial biogenesis protein FimT